MKVYPFTIVVDSREQAPFHFGDWPTGAGTLASEDYSIAGLEEHVAIERKSLADLCGCITYDRDRFKRELQRVKAYPCRAVVVETDLGIVMAGKYRSNISPQSIVGSISSWMIRYEVPFVFAGNYGSEIVLSILRNFYRQCREFAKTFENCI